MWRDFKTFLLKQNVVALAIAVVVGAALNKVVTAIVNDLIMPLVGALTPAGDWRGIAPTVLGVKFQVGDFLGAIVDFLIISFVVWRLAKIFIRPAPPAPTKNCPFCRSSIDPAATRCAHCTSHLADRTADEPVAV